MKPDAETPADVMGEPAVIDIGDAQKAVREADVHIDNVYRTPRYNHNALEPHATIAFWNEDGTLEVLESSQSVNTAGHTLAVEFGLDSRDIQVLAPFVGGGFGGKGGLWNYTPICVAAAKAVKRPVKLVLSREGVYRVVGKRLTKCRVDGLLELWWLKRRSGSESGSSPCCGRIFADTLKRKVSQTG